MYGIGTQAGMSAVELRWEQAVESRVCNEERAMIERVGVRATDVEILILTLIIINNLLEPDAYPTIPNLNLPCNPPSSNEKTLAKLSGFTNDLN